MSNECPLCSLTFTFQRFFRRYFPKHENELLIEVGLDSDPVIAEPSPTTEGLILDHIQKDTENTEISEPAAGKKTEYTVLSLPSNNGSPFEQPKKKLRAPPPQSRTH